MATFEGETVFNILHDYFGPFTPADAFSLVTTVADENYVSIPAKWMRDIILNDPILAPERYRQDIFDCDDYAMFVKTKLSLFAANSEKFIVPIAAGFLLTRAHAFNFGITNEKSLFLINPQSSKVDMVINPSRHDCANFLNITESNRIKFIYI